MILLKVGLHIVSLSCMAVALYLYFGTEDIQKAIFWLAWGIGADVLLIRDHAK